MAERNVSASEQMRHEMNLATPGRRFQDALISGTVMVFLALALGSVFNLARPGKIPFAGDWSPQAVVEIHAGDLNVIHLDDAFKLFAEEKALFIDARSPGEFSAGHIPGSVNIPAEAAAEHLSEVRALAETGKVLIAYCYDVDCPLGADLARKFKELGVSPIEVMPEGWTGWMDKGYPYE